MACGGGGGVSNRYTFENEMRWKMRPQLPFALVFFWEFPLHRVAAYASPLNTAAMEKQGGLLVDHGKHTLIDPSIHCVDVLVP